MSFVEAEVPGGDGVGVVVCRTGYTGERGYELIALDEVAGALWDRLFEAGEPLGMLPCGLGARDTLRTEMGYPLHGQDITIDVTPNQAGLGWAVGWKKDAFWGRDALVAEKESGPKRKLRGLVAVERGIPRPGMLVSLLPDVPLCEITSGTFSPTLKKGIGMALVPTFVDPEAELGVQIRTHREIFRSHPFPFVDRHVGA
jgi:aminomethyltransferase